MKAILMAGGFSKRLFPLTLNRSKCLLELGGKPIIDYTISKLKEISEIDGIIVIVNKTFYDDFVIWAKTHPFLNLRVLSDGGDSENSKVGALTALLNFIEQENLNDDFFLAGADNFFRFSLREIYEIFKNEKKDLAVFYDIKDIEQAKKFGVALLDEKGIIKEFEEKPENPKSTIVSACMYFFRKDTLPLIKRLNK